MPLEYLDEREEGPFRVENELAANLAGTGRVPMTARSVLDGEVKKCLRGLTERRRAIERLEGTLDGAVEGLEAGILDAIGAGATVCETAEASGIPEETVKALIEPLGH